MIWRLSAARGQQTGTLSYPSQAYCGLWQGRAHVLGPQGQRGLVVGPRLCLVIFRASRKWASLQMGCHQEGGWGFPAQGRQWKEKRSGGAWDAQLGA